MPTAPKSKRIYSVEFLRIWFILCVIVYHIYKVSPQIEGDLLQLFHSSGMRLGTATDLFFVIAGFFLYRRIAQGTSGAGEMIKKIYLRLLPVTLFALIICLALGRIKMSNIPFSIAQINGTGTWVGLVLGRGDWFIGVYFWTSCLFIGLFQTKFRWLGLGIITYLSLLMLFRNSVIPPKQFALTNALYYGVISYGLICGISCMGIGMFSAYVADNVARIPKWPIRIIFTIFEIYCLLNIYKYLFDIKACQFSRFNMLLLMGGFMISMVHSWGYISTILNKASAIQYASRYTLPTLYGHIICFHILSRFHNFGWGEYPCGIFVLGGGILLGIMEFHLFEKWLMSKIKFCFRS